MSAHWMQPGEAPARAVLGTAMPWFTDWLAGRSRYFLDTRLREAWQLVLLIWVSHFLALAALVVNGDADKNLYTAHLGMQIVICSEAFFLLSAGNLKSSRILWILAAQVGATATALAWQSWSGGPAVQASSTLVLVSLLSAVVLMLALCVCVYLPGNHSGWLALAASLLGIGFCIERILHGMPPGDISFLSHHGYALLTLVMWHAMVGAPRRREPPQAESPTPSAGAVRVRSGVELAVARERHRIARNLHDGVASHLVSIMSALSQDNPQQQALSLALEQCLLDIKLTVDGMECVDQNLSDALGSLRYRVQRPLDRLGIRMIWDVEMSMALDQVRGPDVEHVLHIAQECLSNVMRHASASEVIVVCRYAADTGRIELEVRDNGVGMASDGAAGTAGRGLHNIEERARLIHGNVAVFSKEGSGTIVFLTFPLMLPVAGV